MVNATICEHIEVPNRIRTGILGFGKGHTFLIRKIAVHVLVLTACAAHAQYKHNTSLGMIDARLSPLIREREAAGPKALDRDAEACLARAGSSSATLGDVYKAIVINEFAKWLDGGGPLGGEVEAKQLRESLMRFKPAETYESLKALFLSRDSYWGSFQWLDVGKKLVQTEPDDVAVKLSLLPVLIGYGRVDSDFDMAHNISLEMLAKHPNFIGVHIWAALYYIQDGKKHPTRTKTMLLRARDEFKQYIKLDHATRATARNAFVQVDRLDAWISHLH